jgi:Glycosyl hydrolases family 18
MTAPAPRLRLRNVLRGLSVAFLLAGTAYMLWSPGATVTDGRHDRGTNGLWLQHGWLGDDAWFAERKRDPNAFRSTEAIAGLAATLRENGITDVFPHLCPANLDGTLPGLDTNQVARLTAALPGVRVLPWIGGVLDQHCLLGTPSWRTNFVASTAALLRDHPGLAGVQVNIEPMPDGTSEFIDLLRALKVAIGPDKILSVAAYPPPTRWHPFPEVHWSEAYFRSVAEAADHLAVMMYDTAIRQGKPYQRLMADWTEEILAWTPADTSVQLGLPVYDDAGSGYHHPRSENLANALAGIHAGLLRHPAPSPSYQGVAIYCEWEMDTAEWAHWRAHFLRSQNYR